MDPRTADGRRQAGLLGLAAVLGALALLSGPACVPEGPKTRSKARAARPASTATHRAAHEPEPSPPLLGPFEDHFDRKTLGPNWRALSKAWRIDDGRLCVQGARNRGVWLRRSLPARARIEFDARSESPDGDIKAELWGDGQSGATKASYGDATSYLTILGGWKNTKHVLARLDEHGRDRLHLDVDPKSLDPRARPVEAGQTYRFRVERADDHTLKWWVDDQLYFELDDPEPLADEGHDHFGFNNWMVPVCFDNLRITPL